MSDPNEPQGDLLQQAKAEISGMAKEGMSHPSTKPVLVGAASGGRRRSSRCRCFRYLSASLPARASLSG